MITLKDVAEKCGINVATVSRMLNGRGYVSEKTKNCINQAMEELNYQPNEIARSLSLKRSKFIGLIVPSSSNMFFCKVIDAVEHYASKNNYRLLLCNSNLQEKKEIEYFNMLGANKVAGVILASHTQYLDKCITFDAPVISIDRIITPQIPSVCSDNYQGGVLAAEHLIAKGCKYLAHISGSAYLEMDANKRCFGFKHVCENKGIPYAILDASEEQFQTMHYDEVVSSLFDNWPEVDGVFTSNDIIAAHVIRVCSERGIKIPDEMKIVGYDDIDLCSLCIPSITTIHQSIDEICRYAVESIVFNSENECIPENKTFPVRLVERGTT
jgi:LacI family sucrose operon transcriptional repressor